MNLRKKICLMVAVIFVISMSVSVVCAQNQNNHSINLKPAQNTVNNIKQADPPQVSTTTKPSPVGQRVTDYKPPAAKSLHVKEVPAPASAKKPAPQK
jgi:hypothetical protein